VPPFPISICCLVAVTLLHRGDAANTTLLNLGATWAQNWTHFAPASPVLGVQAVWNHYDFSRYAEVGYFRVIRVALILQAV
jgi:hypothetical protein